jgi:hypothetical protein
MAAGSDDRLGQPAPGHRLEERATLTRRSGRPRLSPRLFPLTHIGPGAAAHRE